MTTFDQLTSRVLLSLYGYGLSAPRAAFLTQAIGETDRTFTVSNAQDFDQGLAEIGDELVFIDSVSVTDGTLNIAPDGRGYFGTTPAAHDVDTRVEAAPTWPRQKVREAVNHAIVGTYPSLFGVGTASFDYSPSVTTYELPAEVQSVLKVTCGTIGPSEEQLEINRYSFNPQAPTALFDTGCSLTLEEAPFPGRPVTVTYTKEPTALEVGDDFSESGLRESALLAVEFAAIAALLANMDAARLPVGSAQADEYDPSKAGIGTAARASLQLQQRYELELSKERKRLLSTYPPRVTLRKR